MSHNHLPTTPAADADKPWDARLAFRLIYPLRNSFVTPNQLTTLRLLLGLFAAWELARGDYLSANLGALCFSISHFLDHTDGELARLTGKMSRPGHTYDLISDSAVNILLFVGIGIGASLQGLGHWDAVMGLVAGLAVAAIFHMRGCIEETLEREEARQPHWGGFEIEDILYLMPLVTLLDGLHVFLVLAVVGAPLFAVWTYIEWRQVCRHPG